MSLPSIALRRPVLAIVMNIIIILFGVVAYTFLGVRDYPAIDPPIINVRTAYAGANADIIESQITEPLEKAINGIAGIRNISSTSSQGSSNISVEFNLEVDLEAAANDVRDKVSQATRQLPQDIDAPPVVSKADANSQPIVSMTVQSDTKNQLQVTEFATNVLQERLQTIPGVSSIQIWGEKKYAMRIWMKPEQMAAYGVTANDIEDALNRENIELPSGKLSGNASELTVRAFGRLVTEDDFENLIVKNTGGQTVRLGDIADAVLGPENEETMLKEKGTPMIALALVPQPGSNYVAIYDEFNKRYESIKKDIPEGYKVDIALDNVKFIKNSIVEVQETLLLSFILVVMIIYLFFRDWIIAIRPLIDIPVSLIGAFFIMYIMGFTINILTLLAIVLATGLVVDDGIVVTENIFKKLEAGMDKHRAAKEGSEEIYFAVIATSITLAVVFLPIVFLQGFVGRLFREFGIVVAGAVLISAFVSLTLTPVLNVYLTRSNQKPSWFYRKTEPFFQWMESSYANLVTKVLKMRWIGVVMIVFCLGIIYVIGRSLPSELAPMEDRSRFRISLTAPEGTAYDYMDQYVDRVTQMLMDSIPEHKIVLTVTAPGFTGSGAVNTAFGNVVLTEKNERTRSQDQIAQMVNKNLAGINIGKGYAIQEQTISTDRRGGLPVAYVIQNNDFEKLSKALPKILEAAGQNPVLQNIDADLKFNKPELRVEINREKATQMGISVADISRTLQLALSNGRFGYFTMNGKQYQVMGQVSRENRDEPSDLTKYYVRSGITGQLVSLDNLVKMTEQTSPPQIYHFNRYKSATISAGLAPGKTIGDGIKAMNDLTLQLRKDSILDETFQTDLSGASRDFADSSSNTLFAFMLALVLIFLILAAQFESFIDPFIIMLTVPLAIAGAYLSLWLFGQTSNIFSQIGMIMLIGLVTKNGILIVEYANHIREEGKTKFEAATQAAKLRLRPILMTSLAMGLGALPLALSLGAAATSRIPLGIVLVGGITFSLVLTLLVIPIMYTFLSRRQPKPSTAVEKLSD